MSTPALTATSYVILGLVAECSPVTPYDMKERIRISVGNFWPFPHSQVYAEPQRLAGLGLVQEEQEEGGRRRRVYTITDAGRDALDRWFRDPTPQGTELRDLGLLKLHFGEQAEPGQMATLAGEQAAVHARKHEEYVRLRGEIEEVIHPFTLATLELGIRLEAMMAEFWAELRDSHGREG